MYLTCILLCLWGALLSGLFGRKLGVKGSQIISICCVTITTVLVIFIFTEICINHIPVEIKLFKWVDSELLSVLWSFNFDSLTSSMLIPVIIVSNLVHLYSVSYMSNDPHVQRFFSYLSLFTFMMIILVTSNNYLVMFVGWEGVGVCSYLLVSFWFTRVAANQSSIAAFLTNRVGDCLLTVGMFIIIWISGSLDYSVLFSVSSYINENIILLISICLLIGAMAKSSQIGLHVWLPMAMEGPTPVSALIHAATMVTAGVYLLIRSSPVIEYSDTILLVCLWLGGLTSLSSSLIGFFQQDIKKIIAYSTMSQLGMMVIAIGLSSYNVALFHLINHAFYKALLFLGAGSIIHGMFDNQDLRKYGALKLYMPLTYTVIGIASLSLIAFPFLSGFYSKDFILESLFGDYYFSSISVYFLAYIGATFTTLYSIKILYLTFLSNPNGSFIDYKNVHEGNWFMITPLIILSLFSIFFGFISRDLFIGLGTDLYIDNSIFINFKNEIVIDTEFAVPVIFKLLPLITTLIVSFLFISYHENIIFYNIIKYLESNRLYFHVYSYFNQKLFIELFYNKYISEFIFNVGGKTTKILDKGSIEYIGPTGLEWLFEKLSSNLSKLDKGITPLYALYILLGFTLYMLLFSNKINSELLIILLFTLSIYF